MARSDRTGKRKERNQRSPKKIPQLGYYLIVTDASGTEPNYFYGLHESLDASIKDKIVIKVVEARTQNLIQKCLELTAYEAQYRIPWIVFDRDQVVNFDSIIEQAKSNNINVGWSNPCFEIWMFAYCGNMPKIIESQLCCSKFGTEFKKRTGNEYEKNDRDIYKKLKKYGDEEKAISVAQQRYEQYIKEGYLQPSKMLGCSTLYMLVSEINNKIIRG